MSDLSAAFPSGQSAFTPQNPGALPTAGAADIPFHKLSTASLPAMMPSITPKSSSCSQYESTSPTGRGSGSTPATSRKRKPASVVCTEEKVGPSGKVNALKVYVLVQISSSALWGLTMSRKNCQILFALEEIRALCYGFDHLQFRSTQIKIGVYLSRPSCSLSSVQFLEINACHRRVDPFIMIMLPGWWCRAYSSYRTCLQSPPSRVYYTLLLLILSLLMNMIILLPNMSLD